MFTSLPQFYNSDAWRSLRLQIIHDRTNADGILLCEYSGKPLVKSYDIVAHHKIPLTMENVNDLTISLNPENIMIVSQQAHNEIHARFGYTAQRKVYYVYGPPCAGKTTFVNNVKGNSDLVVDMDNIWQCITGGNRYYKPKALNDIFYNIRKLLYEQVKLRVGKWERAFVIDGGALKGDRARKVELLGAEEVFIDTDEKTCLERLYGDDMRTEEQKTEWQKYIRQWFEDYER